VILLDSSALIAFLYGEAAEAEVAALLRSGECVTPSPCLAEVVDQLIRRNGVQPEKVVDHLDPLIEASLGVVPIENRLGWQAGEFRAVYYQRSGADLSLADCLLLACVGPDDKLASSDRALLAAARDLEFDVISLPDSRGRRPDAD
jgi:PIN domain nuclease of toxin-antitoxin system